MRKRESNPQAVPTGGALGRTLGWLWRAALVVALLAGWAAWELHAASGRAVTGLENVTATAAEQFDAFLSRVSAVSRRFGTDSLDPHNRIAITARMLKLEPRLSPAENLFLYGAAGHFIAATLPLFPGDADVSGRPWFEAAAIHPGELLLTATAQAPLGQGEGFVVSRTIRATSGGTAGVIGTFLDQPALKALITPPLLPPGARVSLMEAGARQPMLSFTARTAPPHRWLSRGLKWIDQPERIGEIAQLPGALSLRIDSNVFTEIATAEWRRVLWHGGAVVVGIVVLLWLIRPRRRPRELLEETARALQPVAELEWGWEIDARGRLVGVAGNAPESLLSAIGTNFLDLVADDVPGQDLREAIAERTPVHDLELALVLPGNSAQQRRRFRVNGRFVADTGGFWGTAEEVPAVEQTKEAAD